MLVYCLLMATQEDYDRIQADIDDVGRRITALNQRIDERNKMLGID